MRSPAKLSPTSRGIADVELRISRLERYEAWANCQPLRVEELVDPELWNHYYKLQDEILTKMRDAQTVALEIGKGLKNTEKDSRG
jgi:hypothetical protein